MLTRFTSELYVQNMVFDYSTKYFWSHPVPSVIDSLRVTESDLEDFGSFLKEKNFSYQTDSEAALEDLVAVAKEEQLYDENIETIDKLKAGMSHSLASDLETQKRDVAELLESELAGRYFYDAGMVQYSLSRDNQVAEAVRIAEDTSRYRSLLQTAVR
jgi:carboxyl-terminal processing protease